MALNCPESSSYDLAIDSSVFETSSHLAIFNFFPIGWSKHAAEVSLTQMNRMDAFAEQLVTLSCSKNTPSCKFFGFCETILNMRSNSQQNLEQEFLRVLETYSQAIRRLCSVYLNDGTVV
jgi:hypothetical protein